MNKVLNNENRRFYELDSMRGLAAIVVVFNHYRNLFYHSCTFMHGWQTVFLYPLVSGHESVVFFFLLSGFVLSLPFLRNKSQPYPVFVYRRVLRIYGPYVAALVLSIMGCAIWHGQIGPPWAWPAAVTAHSVFQHVLFIGNYDYASYNVAFWSLVYEMRISLIFPLLFLVANRLPVWATGFVILAFTAIGVHATEHKTLLTFQCAGIFLIGILLAKNLPRVSGMYKSLGTTSRMAFIMVSLVLYFGNAHIQSFGLFWHLGNLPIAAGAAGLLILAVNAEGFRWALNLAVPRFLGHISYSLYLVHGTVLFSMEALLRDRISPVGFFLLFITTAIVLSWIFYLAVEKPFMRWSRGVGKRVKPGILVPAIVGSLSAAGSPDLNFPLLDPLPGQDNY